MKGYELSIDQALEVALRRDRVIVLAALATVILVSWAYVLAGAGMEMSALEMTRMSLSQSQAASGALGEATMAKSGDMGRGGMAGMAIMTPAAWDLGYAVLMFFMWWIMMIAMMLPSATPMILLFARINRKQRERGNSFAPTGIFALAYLVVWAGFSLAAAGLQWSFERLTLLSPVLIVTSAALGGALLFLAGFYQFTPLKQACLKHCRSPIHFISRRWRKGAGGAFRMGIEHGAFCVGCCWFLMGLLFLGGVMNLYWIAGLSVFVLLEKTIPAGHWLGHAAGLALMAWGGWVLVEAI